MKMEVAIIVWPVKPIKWAKECKAGKILHAHCRLSCFLQACSWQPIGNKWHLTWKYLPFFGTSLASAIVCALSPSFLSFRSFQVLLFSLNNYWLWNAMVSAKCFKCYPVLTATLQGSGRLNDFQGHKLRRGKRAILIEGCPNGKALFLCLYNALFY